MKSAASPRNETTKLSALATGLRLMITAAPKISITKEKVQKRNGDMLIADCGSESRGSAAQSLTCDLWSLTSFFGVPFQDHAVHDAADLEQFLFMVDHVFASEASDGVIFPQINCLFRANFLTHAAVNAADHIDIECVGKFFDLGEAIGRRNLGGDNFDCARRANEFTQLTGDAADPAVGIAHQGGRAAVM